MSKNLQLLQLLNKKIFTFNRLVRSRVMSFLWYYVMSQVLVIIRSHWAVSKFSNVSLTFLYFYILFFNNEHKNVFHSHRLLTKSQRIKDKLKLINFSYNLRINQYFNLYKRIFINYANKFLTINIKTNLLKKSFILL